MCTWRPRAPPSQCVRLARSRCSRSTVLGAGSLCCRCSMTQLTWRGWLDWAGCTRRRTSTKCGHSATVKTARHEEAAYVSCTTFLEHFAESRKWHETRWRLMDYLALSFTPRCSEALSFIYFYIFSLWQVRLSSMLCWYRCRWLQSCKCSSYICVHVVSVLFRAHWSYLVFLPLQILILMQWYMQLLADCNCKWISCSLEPNIVKKEFFVVKCYNQILPVVRHNLASFLASCTIILATRAFYIPSVMDGLSLFAIGRSAIFS